MTMRTTSSQQMPHFHIFQLNLHLSVLSLQCIQFPLHPKTHSFQQLHLTPTALTLLFLHLLNLINPLNPNLIQAQMRHSFPQILRKIDTPSAIHQNPLRYWHFGRGHHRNPPKNRVFSIILKGKVLQAHRPLQRNKPKRICLRVLFGIRREGAELGFEEQRESGIRVGAMRGEREIGGNDKRGVLGRAVDANPRFESER
nr:hypothetical protein Iba_chr13fCG5610 [Ipomoea batatas]